MATIQIDIPDAQISRVRDGLADYFNYPSAQLPGETKAQFAKRMVAAQIKEWVRSGERVATIRAIVTQPDPDVS